jgi:hypothetical protein
MHNGGEKGDKDCGGISVGCRVQLLLGQGSILVASQGVGASRARATTRVWLDLSLRKLGSLEVMVQVNMAMGMASTHVGMGW